MCESLWMCVCISDVCVCVYYYLVFKHLWLLVHKLFHCILALITQFAQYNRPSAYLHCYYCLLYCYSLSDALFYCRYTHMYIQLSILIVELSKSFFHFYVFRSSCCPLRFYFISLCAVMYIAKMTIKLDLTWLDLTWL